MNLTFLHNYYYAYNFSDALGSNKKIDFLRYKDLIFTKRISREKIRLQGKRLAFGHALRLSYVSRKRNNFFLRKNRFYERRWAKKQKKWLLKNKNKNRSFKRPFNQVAFNFKPRLLKGSSKILRKKKISIGFLRFKRAHPGIFLINTILKETRKVRIILRKGMGRLAKSFKAVLKFSKKSRKSKKRKILKIMVQPSSWLNVISGGILNEFCVPFLYRLSISRSFLKAVRGLKGLAPSFNKDTLPPQHLFRKLSRFRLKLKLKLKKGKKKNSLFKIKRKKWKIALGYSSIYLTFFKKKKRRKFFRSWHRRKNVLKFFSYKRRIFPIGWKSRRYSFFDKKQKSSLKSKSQYGKKSLFISKNKNKNNEFVQKGGKLTFKAKVKSKSKGKVLVKSKVKALAKVKPRVIKFNTRRERFAFLRKTRRVRFSRIRFGPLFYKLQRVIFSVRQKRWRLRRQLRKSFNGFRFFRNVYKMKLRRGKQVKFATYLKGEGYDTTFCLKIATIWSFFKSKNFYGIVRFLKELGTLNKRKELAVRNLFNRTFVMLKNVLRLRSLHHSKLRFKYLVYSNFMKGFKSTLPALPLFNVFTAEYLIKIGSIYVLGSSSVMASSYLLGSLQKEFYLFDSLHLLIAFKRLLSYLTNLVVTNYKVSGFLVLNTNPFLSIFLKKINMFVPLLYGPTFSGFLSNFRMYRKRLTVAQRFKIRALPKTIFLLKEDTLALEALKMKIPTGALLSSKVKVSKITYPIFCNRQSMETILFTLLLLNESILKGLKLRHVHFYKVLESKSIASV